VRAERASEVRDAAVFQNAAPLQALGRAAVGQLYTALRSAQIYDERNETVARQLDRLHRTLGDVLRLEGAADLALARSFFYLNGVRLKVDLQVYVTYQQLLRALGRIGVGRIELRPGLDAGELRRFLFALARAEPEAADPFAVLQAALASLDLPHVAVGGLEEAVEGVGGGGAAEPDGTLHGRALRTYSRSVEVTRTLFESARSGRAMNVRRVRRVVQSIVDHVLQEELSLIGLTTLRDVDEPTFRHVVNVCIFSVALGQRVGLSKLELYELGLAALFHDLGKADVPRDVLQKPGSFTPEEWDAMKSHTWRGARRLLDMRGQAQIPIREMLVAFEHHLNLDLSGYPAVTRPRRLHFYSKIVAIADAFDAGTTPRIYKTEPMEPHETLKIIDMRKGKHFDPVLVKAFIAMMGIYPVGTLVILDTFELAVVFAANPDPREIHRPVVKLISDAAGNRLEGRLVDLAERDPGTGGPRRTIVKVTEPERYGVNPGEYFL
jgi:HD-GYP domain-containing protein (c-di-GMP phosphodiesterase class II)